MRTRGFASPTAADVRRRLGIAGVGGRREIEAAAQLVEGQRLVAVTPVIWRRHAWVLVASDRAVYLVRRPRFVGRARDERFDWAELTAVEAGTTRLELRFGDRALKLVPGSEETTGLHQAALRHLDVAPEPTTDAEIRAIANRDLGLIPTLEHYATLGRVAGSLEPGERVERLACATLDFDGLLVVTDERLLLIEIAEHAWQSREWSVARDEVRGARAVEGGLWLDLGDREVTLTGSVPAHLSDVFAPAAPEPSSLAPMPAGDRYPMTVRRSASGELEFDCHGRTIARLSPAPGRAGFAVAIGETGEQRLGFSCRRARGGWNGIVETPDAVQVASYRPNWLFGGRITFHDRAYRLRFRYVTSAWTLRDDSGHKLAHLGVRASGGGIDAINADVRPSGSTSDLVALLVAVWVIEIERWMGGAG